MITFKADDNNDFEFSNSNLSLISGDQAILQTCKEYMQARLTEMIYNYNNGIPYNLLAWSRDVNIQQFTAFSRKRLLQVNGVVEVVSFDATQDKDVLSYIATIKTENSEVTLKSRLLING